MRTRLKSLIVASTLVAGIAAAPVLFAHSAEDTPGTQVAPMGHDEAKGHGGMMGQGHETGQDTKTEQGNMMGMMMMKAMMEAHDAAPSDKK